MYDERRRDPLKNQPPSSPTAPLLPRCSMTTFLYRIAFTVWHATLHLERVGQGFGASFHHNRIILLSSAINLIIGWSLRSQLDNAVYSLKPANKWISNNATHTTGLFFVAKRSVSTFNYYSPVAWTTTTTTFLQPSS